MVQCLIENTDSKQLVLIDDETLANRVTVQRRGGHTSVSLTGMLIREQISDIQKQIEWLKTQTQNMEQPKIHTPKMTFDDLFRFWFKMPPYTHAWLF